MSNTTADAVAMINRLALEVAGLIELNSLPEDMAPYAISLPPLYKARSFGSLPAEVEITIGRIEQAAVRMPHFACSGCKAVFVDKEDLGPIQPSPLKPVAAMPAGSCPACGSEVLPRNAKE